MGHRLGLHGHLLPCHWEAISEVGFDEVVGTNNNMRELKYKRTERCSPR